MEEQIGLYNQIVRDHLSHPRNMGEIENPDGFGEAYNPICGDTMRFFIKVESDRIIDVKFLTYGCSAAIASSSIATELIKGKTIGEALNISKKVIDEALGGLPQAKSHGPMLAEIAIRAALTDYKKKKDQIKFQSV